jgi:hypothetical protein
MRLKEIIYKENLDSKTSNPWELERLQFGDTNLILGRNATGKTRILRLINNIASLVARPSSVITGKLLDGDWELTFRDINSTVKYAVKIEQSKVVNEIIKENDTTKLNRDSITSIYSESKKEMQTISPPDDKLVLHIRRDTKEYPFLEKIINWAEGVHLFEFTSAQPNFIEIPSDINARFTLHSASKIWESLTDKSKNKIYDNIRILNYNIVSIESKIELLPTPILKGIVVKEENLIHPIEQSNLSSGLFRTLALLIVLEHLRTINNAGLVLVDDIGEGLDYERSSKLAVLLKQYSKDSNIQLIATTNDSFMADHFPLEDCSVCTRVGTKVSNINQFNSPEKIKEWSELGLGNFDLFTSDFLK